MYVKAVALEHRVGAHRYNYVQIAVRPAVDARVAQALQAQALIVVNAGRHLYLHALGAAGLAAAVALGARRFDDPALAAAARAGLRALHYAKRRALLHRYIARTAAIRAGIGAGALGRAAAAALGADILPVHAHGFGAAVRGLHKAKRQANADVAALARRVRVCTAAPAAHAEDIAQIAKQIAQIHTARAVIGIDARVAELIVPGALLRIAQDLVGLPNLFELFLGLFVAGVQVGVVFFRQLAVGAFDLVLRGRLGNAKHLVVIAFFSHTFSP